MSEHQKMWKAFEANEISHSVAHYLLAVDDHTQNGASPRAADVARTLEVSRAAVSLQLRTLKDHNLVEVTEDNRIHLTPQGKDVVGRITSKRHVLRTFLNEILGVDEPTAEADACKIEHLISEESGAALVRFMTYLRSTETGAKVVLDDFRKLTDGCPPEQTCDFCTTQCLLNPRLHETRKLGR